MIEILKPPAINLKNARVVRPMGQPQDNIENVSEEPVIKTFKCGHPKNDENTRKAGNFTRCKQYHEKQVRAWNLKKKMGIL